MDNLKIIGGDYTAKQNDDKTWNVYDVPIFAEHKVKGRPAIDKEWLLAAVERSKDLQEKNKYLAPLHVNHHEFGGKVISAGFVFPKKVEEIELDGKNIWTLFADFLSISDEMYGKIKAGRLPYRSVEVLDPDKPEITSLALLSHDAPFFKFPLLKIAKEVVANTFKVGKVAVSAKPLLAYSEVAMKDDTERVFYLSNFEEVAMPDKKDDEKDKKKDEKAQEGEPDMMALLKTLIEKVAGIEKALADLVAEDEEEEPSKPEGETPVEMKAQQDKVVKLEGEVKGLTSKVEGYEQKNKYMELVDKTVGELSIYGITKNDKNEFMAVLQKYGEQGLVSYVDGIKKTATKEPTSFEAIFGAKTISDIPELKNFANSSPEEMDKVLGYKKLWDNMDVLAKQGQTVGSFIESQLYRDKNMSGIKG